jgi:hypothetical protein
MGARSGTQGRPDELPRPPDYFYYPTSVAYSFGVVSGCGHVEQDRHVG